MKIYRGKDRSSQISEIIMGVIIALIGLSPLIAMMIGT